MPLPTLEKNKQHGFIALTSILIISALILLLVVGVSLRSIGATNIALDFHQATRALTAANACAEIGLMKLLTTHNYLGNETIAIGSQNCFIANSATTTANPNLNRTFKTTSTVANFTRKNQVAITQVSPTTTISSWQEVADF